MEFHWKLSNYKTQLWITKFDDPVDLTLHLQNYNKP